MSEPVPEQEDKIAWRIWLLTIYYGKEPAGRDLPEEPSPRA